VVLANSRGRYRELEMIHASESCFHCGEPVNDARFAAVVHGELRSMCCAGCAAIAQTIADNGLAEYYTARSAPATRDSGAGLAGDPGIYDLPEVQKPFVRRTENGTLVATLLVEGMSCGACIWLIENGLKRCAGVQDVIVNLAARRVQVEWNGTQARLSTIMGMIESLGYRAHGFDTVAAESVAAVERRRMVWRLFVAGLAMMQVMMYALPVYMAGSDMGADVERLMRWASLVLTTPVVLFSAGPFFTSAWRGLRHGQIGMDLPVAMGIAIAFAASSWSAVTGRGEVYFDSITMFVFLLLGARYLEQAAMARAGELRLRLTRSIPAVADRLVPGSTPPVAERVAAVRLAPGDRVRVSPGAIIPADGTIEEGHSRVDESLLSGESRPIARGPGDQVVGGSVNLISPLTVSVTRTSAEGTLAGITRLLDRALGDRPRVSRLADRAAQWFVAGQLIVAIAAGLAWWWVEPGRALSIVVAVLVVSCPCALSLATPAALAVATGSLQRFGLLVTRGRALESLSRATHVILDKTGTLTFGRPVLTGVYPLGELDRDACIALAAALERGSEHPLAAPIVAGAAGLPLVEARELGNHPGRGIEGIVGGRRLRLGSPAFAAEMTCSEMPAQLLSADDNAVVSVLADERGYLAILALSDALRPGARRLVQGLQARGMTVCMLSGDRARAVDHVARQLGVDGCFAEADPQRKLAYVRGLQERGAIVAMVGDGINDAPVLAQAQVSVAMGGGTDLALATADLVLLSDDIDALPAGLDVARRTMRVIRQNLAWAAAYNAVAIPAAVAGWITPLAAGVGMAASSLLVVGNALRLGRLAKQENRDPDRRGAPVFAVREK
jgi:Cu2+-exporting ATPase